MNQKISVRAIVKHEGKVLLLKRANGRSSILGKYELPGGRLEYNEQPEDALKRILRIDAAVSIQTVQLFDAITYIDYDDRNIQYIVVVYLVSMRSDQKPLELSQNYNKFSWQKQSFIQHENITDLTELVLGIIRQDKITEGSISKITRDDVKHATDRTIIHSDGASRGNPGPSAAGFVIMDSNETILETGGEYVGVTDNNIAEYKGVYLALKRASELGIKKIDFRSDSSMVVNQLNGIYKIKNRDLWQIHEQIAKLTESFDKISFTHVRREFNQVADKVVNDILDQRQ